MMTFWDFLRYRDRTAEELGRLQEKLDQQWTACIGMGWHSDSGSIGGGTGGPRDGPLVSFADTMDLLLQARSLQIKQDKLLTGFLKTMEARPGHGRRDALILRDRYLKNMTWPDIVADLEKEGYHAVLRTVYLWHSDALRWANNLWEELYRDDGLHKGAGV